MGPGTRSAIRAFEASLGLDETGEADTPLVEALLRLTGGPTRLANATIHVRQNGRDVYWGPVELADTDAPLGTHVYVYAGRVGGSGAHKWHAMTVTAKGRLPGWSRKQWRRRLARITPMTPRTALERISIPMHTRTFINDHWTPGSSLIIADRGSERETGQSTDFIVLTD